MSDDYVPDDYTPRQETPWQRAQREALEAIALYEREQAEMAALPRDRMEAFRWLMHDAGRAVRPDGSQPRPFDVEVY